PSKNGKWGDCGGGKVFLRMVETSDFYVEPFLKDKPLVKAKTPEVTNRTTTSKPPTKPLAKQTPPVAKKTAPVVSSTPKTSTKKPAITLPTTSQKKVTEVTSAPAETKPETRKLDPKPITIPVETRSRQNETAKVVVVNSTEVTVKLYDNGEVDGDTISVYLDNQLILSRKGLTTAPITLTVKLDENASEHTLVMVAENMGRIPPNTALMVVQDGDNRYQANLTSTEQKNAMVRFRYQKPAH
ncbi:MAG: hypothetical protein JWP88_852, partial [Flaviaesturariibacter sp.]|nr:hypothetical protein [Flaviaesturariibacter sp.]